MRQAQVGRADLLRVLVEGGEELQTQLALHLGFGVEEVPEETPQTRDVVRVRDEYIAQKKPRTRQRPTQSFAPSSTPFWRPVSFSVREGVPPPPKDVDSCRTDERMERRLSFDPLAPLPLLLMRLRQLAELHRPGSQPDVEQIVRFISRGRTFARIPRRSRRTWGFELTVLVDLNRHLIPYRGDWFDLRDGLVRQLPETELIIAELGEGQTFPRVVLPDERYGRHVRPAQNTTVIAATDLGCLADDAALRRVWCDLGRRFTEAQARCVALLPGRPEIVPAELARWWKIVPWERGVQAAGRVSAAETDRSTLRLLAFAALTKRIEPRLLRAIRRSFPEGRRDAGLEARVWAHPALSSDHYAAATVSPEYDDELLERLKDEDERVLQAILDCLYNARREVLDAVWNAEVLNMPDFARRLLPAEDLQQAKNYFERLNDRFAGGDKPIAEVDFAWHANSLHRTEARRQNPVLDAIWVQLAGEDSGETPPESLDPGRLVTPADVPSRIRVRQQGTVWEVHRVAETPDRDEPARTPLVELRTRAKRIRIDHLPSTAAELAFDVDRDFWAGGRPPEWAKRWGVDDFGPWAELEVPVTATTSDEEPSVLPERRGSWWRSLLGRRREAEPGATQVESTVGADVGIRQRMRWIPAGTFWMGSPEDEPGRRGAEGPSHRVTLSRGFWMFDTPGTQALWEALTGDNPSEFKSPTRPVERVSWQDCRKFIERMNDLVPGMDIDLPSEAEWEYACRAGTKSALYTGSIEILGENNAPALDKIAWYGGNSGIDFELDDGWDASGWREKQYEFDKAGTHPVGQKLANAWGLYDMLGNVFEWTRDAQHDYTRDACTDPEHPGTSSADRVVRGGSWNRYARYVRAAFRNWRSPVHRSNGIGFRCRVQSGEPSRQAAELREETERAVGGRGEAERSPDSPPASGVAPSGPLAPRGPLAPSGPLAPRGPLDPSGPLAPRGPLDPSGPLALRERVRERDAAHPATATTPNFAQNHPAKPLHGAAFLDRLAQMPLESLPRPGWSSDFGRDEFGLWADITIESKGERAAVTQRLRMIPPGTFRMGSPSNEQGRFDSESPQHEVTISEAFWMFDSPCTQALWQAVMGKNSSHFQGDNRPVESVSWNDCQEFNQRLKEVMAGMDVHLPTEAEWEYACRAGTTTATYAGDLQIQDDRAAELESIAWYWANSGDGTNAVRKKKPNGWGLYDTLGNVREWCLDGRRDYTLDPVVDPLGPTGASADRVVRGGSWSSSARGVRAAYRSWRSPDARNSDVGFRCRVQSRELQQFVDEYQASKEAERVLSVELGR